MLRLMRSFLILVTLSISVSGLTEQDSDSVIIGKAAGDYFPGIGEYYFNGVAGNWTEAYQQCRLSGGHLPIISSEDEADVLKVLMAKYGASSIHAGFNDIYVEGMYYTLYGQPVNNGWAPGNPKAGSTHNCGGYTATGLVTTDCAIKSVFICELSDEQVVDAGVPPGYTQLPGFNFYKTHPVKKSWPEAWATCIQEGAHLLLLNSAEETAAVLKNYPNEQSWVGVNRVYGGNNNFVTIYGEPLVDTGYSTWHGNLEPFGNFKSHPYTALWAETGGLYMLPDVVTFFICEYEA